MSSSNYEIYDRKAKSKAFKQQQLENEQRRKQFEQERLKQQQLELDELMSLKNDNIEKWAICYLEWCTKWHKKDHYDVSISRILIEIIRSKGLHDIVRAYKQYNHSQCIESDCCCSESEGEALCE